MHAIVVVPTYNKRENLALLIEKIENYANNLHILVVDDNSPDGTGKLADELRQEQPDRLFVLHRQKKDGLGRAYVEGFKQALTMGYDTILQMDADLSHDPCYLPRFLEAICTSDLVLGSRYINGISVINWDLKRLMLSKMATRYVQLITGMPFTDATGGFKCWRRATLESIDIERLFSNGYLFQIETTYMAYRKGAKIAEVPIVFTERNLGKSKMNCNII